MKDRHICEDECKVTDPTKKCGFKIVDVDCFKKCNPQSSPSYSEEPTLTTSQPHAMIMEGPEQHAQVLVESKTGERYCCHRGCEDVYSGFWLELSKSICKRDCNIEYPSNKDQCWRLLRRGPCYEECVSALDNMDKLADIEGTLFQSCLDQYKPKRYGAENYDLTDTITAI